ncbi:MAG: alginate export family protein [Planctomycetes bacterium]|nr:alginate export family protein [Planctomycetota bacterium]
MRHALAGLLLVCGFSCCLVSSVQAQSSAPSPADDKATIEKLMKKIEALEARVQQLEAGRTPVPAAGEAKPGPGGTEGAASPLPKVDAPLLERLTFGGRVRLRGEWRSPADYRVPGAFGRSAKDDPADDSDFVVARTRVNADATVSARVRAFIELQDSRAWGDEASVAADSADIDLKQGYLEFRRLWDEPLSLKAGRMELPSLGDGRMISPLDWHNVGRSWDGLHLTCAPEGWSLQALVTNLKEGSLVAQGDVGDDYIFAGVYASCRRIDNHEFDLYLYHRTLSDDAFTGEKGGSPGDRYDYTPGVRAKGKAGGFDYSGEAAYQFGDQSGDRIRAWAAAATAGYTFDAAWKPRIGAEYAFASGDSNPTDGRVGTFDPLLPFAHFYHGHMDLVGWRNLHAVMATLKAAPRDHWSIHLDTHFFWLDEKTDAWYGVGGTGIRRDTAGDSGSYLGSEIDLYTKFRLWERVEFWTGYSHFFPGRFVDRTGDDPDGDWLFFQTEVKF